MKLLKLFDGLVLQTIVRRGFKLVNAGASNLAQVYGIGQTAEFCAVVTSLRWFIIKVPYCCCNPFVVNSFYWYVFFNLQCP